MLGEAKGPQDAGVLEGLGQLEVASGRPLDHLPVLGRGLVPDEVQPDATTRADEAIQRVWQCLRRLAVPCGAKYPEPQPPPTSLDEAVRQLDPVINWCIEQERELVEEATSGSTGQSSSQVSVGIVIALKEEFNELFREIRNACVVEADPQTGNRFYRFERAGASAAYQCVATWAGEMGPERAILITERLLAVWNPKVVVNIGIAAGVDKDVRVGDTLIATQVDNYLHRSRAVASDTGDGFSLEWSGAVYPCSQDIIAAVRNFQFAHEDTYREWRNRGASRLKKFVPDEQRSQLIARDLIRKRIEYAEGHLASGPIVGASSAFREWLKTRDRAFLGLEMEAAGVLAALYARADLKRSLILRGISDYGDERKKELDEIKAGALRRYAMCNALHLLWLLLKVDALPH